MTKLPWRGPEEIVGTAKLPHFSGCCYRCKNVEIVQERHHRNGIRRFKHRNFQLNIHLHGPASYIARYAAVVLLRLRLEEVVVGVQ